MKEGEVTVKKTLKQWLEMAHSEPENLLLINPRLMESFEREQVESMHEQLLLLIDTLFVEARAQGVRFIDEEKRHRKKDDEDRTSLRTRVRKVVPYNVSCEWHVARMTKNIKPEVKKEWVVLSRFLKKRAKYRYSRKVFDQSADWVYPFGNEIEDFYEIIRRKNETLSKIRDLLYHYDRLTQAYFDLIDSVVVENDLRNAPIDAKRVKELMKSHAQEFGVDVPKRRKTDL